MEPEKIERTIQWFGLLKVPPDIKNVKWWRLSADIIRPQLSDYRNDKYPIPQGFWGYVQSMYAGRVLRTYRISYKNEILAFEVDTDLFLQQTISCSLEAILESFVELGTALGFPVVRRKNPIKKWRNDFLLPDEFKIRLIAENTVFKFTYEFEAQETCDVTFSDPPQPPPPPPPPPPNEVPPTTGNGLIPPISPPYQGPDDNGETYNPGELNPPPIGEPCQIMNVNYTVSDPGNENFVTRTETQQVFGIVEGTYRELSSVGVNQFDVGIICGGKPPSPCIPGTKFGVVSGFTNEGKIVINSITAA